MSPFATRLDQFIGYLRLSKRAFEEECSIAQGNVSHCIKNNTTLSSKNIVKISNKYKELNLNWLINGNGRMLSYSNSNFSAQMGKKSFPEKNPIKKVKKEFDSYIEMIQSPFHLVESIVKSHPEEFGFINKGLSELEYIHTIAGTVSKGSDAQKNAFYISSSYCAMRKLLDLGFTENGIAFGKYLLKKTEWNHSYHISADICKSLVDHYYKYGDLETAQKYDDLFHKYNQMYLIEYEAQKLYNEVIYNYKHGLPLNKEVVQSSLHHIRSKMGFDSYTYHYFYYQCQCILSEGQEYLDYCEEAINYFTNLYFNHEAYIAIFANKVIYHHIENNNLEVAQIYLNDLLDILIVGSSRWFSAMYSQINLFVKLADYDSASNTYMDVIQHPAFIERPKDARLEWQALGVLIEKKIQKQSENTNGKNESN